MNTINGQNNSINNNIPAEQTVKFLEKNHSAGSSNAVNHSADVQKNTNNQNNNREKINPEEITESVEKANKLVLIFDKSIKFVYNPKIKMNFIDIVDNNTNEVIKKIPSDDIRRFLEAVKDAVGMIVDEKA